MGRLNQVIAVEKGHKARTLNTLTEINKLFQKPPLFNGFSKTYTPKDEEGDRLPPENLVVQQQVELLLRQAGDTLTELLDVQFTKDTANSDAVGTITVDGESIADNVPVTFLLQLEKQLVNWRTIIGNLPLTDPSRVWNPDTSTGLWRTDPVDTVRSKKVLQNHVKAEATDRHPAQVETYTTDVPVGTWRTVNVTGAVHKVRQDELLVRVNKLIDAVKSAIEEANSIEVQQRKIGADLFNYLLASE